MDKKSILILFASIAFSVSGAWTENKGVNCYGGAGAIDMEKTKGQPCGTMSLAECEQKCNDLSGCTGVTFSTDKKCFRRKDIHLSRCTHDSWYITYVKSAPAPTPPPSPPKPTPKPTPTPPSPPKPTPTPTPTPPTPPSPTYWKETKAVNCYNGHGAKDLEKTKGQPCGTMSLAACKQKCNDLSGCTGITVSAGSGKQKCYRRGNIDLSGCDHGSTGYNTYLKSTSPPTPPGPPSPPTPPPPPTPPTPPTPENPLGITPNPRRSDNFFLIIGDWGAPTGESWSHSTGGCQKKVAQLMKDYVTKYKKQGKKCLFVGAVGDNFYASGVKDDNHWKTQWGDVYGTNDPLSALHSIPWLAVMGNHDIGSSDPTCACGGQCKQFNKDKGGSRPAGTEKYWMPDYYWYYYIAGVNLEILGLDTNAVDVGGIGGNGCGGGGKVTCQKCGGQAKIQTFLNAKKTAGMNLLDERAQKTNATTAVILQHYSGSLGKQLKDRFDGHKGKATQVLSAYGHAHEQVCEGSRDHGCDTILTGGGGGWQGGGYFGFTAVHLTDDGGYHTVLETSEVRFRQSSCKYLTHEDDHMWNVTDSELVV